ncbi:sucrase ferredoxin [Rhodococcus erythropolis]|uniref:sucrase ferredoxin n=1 Tax=Rhodococcus erythropolis TaxID=1833 RepID=UPI00406BDA36
MADTIGLVIEAETCSALSAVDEPLAGSAAVVRGWVCLEFNAAWGRDVLDGTALGEELAAELSRRADAADVRIMFIRRPGRTDPLTDGHTVLLARSDPSDSWCERLRIDSPADLLDIDFALLDGPPPGLGDSVDEPVVLVCAHGKRDQCCAVFGRPIAAALMSSFGPQVWECSHTGGHRFAPSMILLPSGNTYGRLSAGESVTAVEVASRDQVHLPGLRGRSCWSPAGQASEIAVRQQISCGIDDLAIIKQASDGTCVVAQVDGRRWMVETAVSELAPRPPSCGAAPKPVRPVVVTSIREL